MTNKRSSGAGEGKSCKHKSAAEDLEVSTTGSRRSRSETEGAPIRLRCWGRDLCEVTTSREIDLSQIVLELPLSELSGLLPRHLAVQLYGMVKRFFAGQAGPHFPCDVADLRHNEAVVAPLRARLAHVRHLAELITNPPTILVDEGQKLFFYLGIPVLLRPASFVYMLLLAQTPGEWVLRESIYQRLWPGEMNYEGTNMPYERQITDQKRKLLDDIRKGIAGKMESSEAEMESLIIARHKMGYMLNLGREDVVIIRKMALGATPLWVLFFLDRFFSEWFNWLHVDIKVQTFF